MVQEVFQQGKQFDNRDILDFPHRRYNAKYSVAEEGKNNMGVNDSPLKIMQIPLVPSSDHKTKKLPKLKGLGQQFIWHFLLQDTFLKSSVSYVVWSKYSILRRTQSEGMTVTKSLYNVTGYGYFLQLIAMNKQGK